MGMVGCVVILISLRYFSIDTIARTHHHHHHHHRLINAPADGTNTFENFQAAAMAIGSNEVTVNTCFLVSGKYCY